MSAGPGAAKLFPTTVAPFPGETFASQTEYEAHEEQTSEIRKTRWLYEQSLGTYKAQLSSPGTCGICLTVARFSSSTRHGDQAPSGLIPNWREQMACGCERALINRERALVHYLIASGRMRPWMRVGLFGQHRRLANALEDFGVLVDMKAERLEDAHGIVSGRAAAFDILISVEEMSPILLRSEIMARIVEALELGGAVTFTAPFIHDLKSRAAFNTNRAALDWSDLDALKTRGFRRTLLTRYWSNEFGYLGPLNFLITAVK